MDGERHGPLHDAEVSRGAPSVWECMSRLVPPVGSICNTGCCRSSIPPTLPPPTAQWPSGGQLPRPREVLHQHQGGKFILSNRVAALWSMRCVAPALTSLSTPFSLLLQVRERLYYHDGAEITGRVSALVLAVSAGRNSKVHVQTEGSMTLPVLLCQLSTHAPVPPAAQSPPSCRSTALRISSRLPGSGGRKIECFPRHVRKLGVGAARTACVKTGPSSLLYVTSMPQSRRPVGGGHDGLAQL